VFATAPNNSKHLNMKLSIAFLFILSTTLFVAASTASKEPDDVKWTNYKVNNLFMLYFRIPLVNYCSNNRIDTILLIYCYYFRLSIRKITLQRRKRLARPISVRWTKRSSFTTEIPIPPTLRLTITCPTG